MTTLFDVALPVAQIVQNPQRGAATASGTTSTLVDAVRVTQNGYFNGGTLFFITGLLAGKFVRITSYNQGVFTFDTQTNQTTAADQYLAIPAETSLYDILGAINLALLDIGTILKEDVTVTTVAAQEEYALPTTGAGVANVVKVEIAQNAAAPYDYAESIHWSESVGKLRFDVGFRPGTTGNKIRITYLAAHSTLNIYSDVLDPSISKAWLVHSATAQIYQELFNQTKDKKFENLFSVELGKAERYKNDIDTPIVVHAASW
jgi:hypothetical protein